MTQLYIIQFEEKVVDLISNLDKFKKAYAQDIVREGNWPYPENRDVCATLVINMDTLKRKLDVVIMEISKDYNL